MQEKLLSLMRLVGMTDSELARLTGITRQGIGLVASGETRSPKGDTVVAIASVFGVTTDCLLRDGHELPPDELVVSSVEAARARYAAAIAPTSAGAA